MKHELRDYISLVLAAIVTLVIYAAIAVAGYTLIARWPV